MTISTPLGAVLRDDDGVRLEFVRTFPTTVDDLWSAITDSDRCARWFGSWTGDPASGTIDLVMTAEDDDTPQPVSIVECTEPTRLVLEMAAPDGTWRLVLDLTTIAEGAQLVFTQQLAEPYDAASIGPGWHYYLDRLAAVVTDQPIPADWSAYETLAAQYPLPD